MALFDHFSVTIFLNFRTNSIAGTGDRGRCSGERCACTVAVYPHKKCLYQKPRKFQSGCQFERRVLQLCKTPGALRMTPSKGVANKQYIERLQMAIRHLHHCESTHVETASVKETFNGQTVWEGEVEVFSVVGHPRARKAYAWSENQGQPDEKFTAVLEIPPVKSPLDAVKVSILAGYKKSGT